MRGRAPILALAILGCFACGVYAQHGAMLQSDAAKPFAEEIKQLEGAADRAARRAAFAAILRKGTELKQKPEPLLSILNNKKPEDTFKDLLEYIRDEESARHLEFVQPLVLAANDPGENARSATQAVVAYRRVGDAVPIIIRMLKSSAAGERIAAAAIAGKRVGGAAGAAKLIPHLVAALDSGDADLSAVAMNSLRKQTWLQLQTAEEWRAWVKGKSELDLITEIADRETEERRKAEAARAKMEETYTKGVLDDMAKREAGDLAALTLRLNEEITAIRLRAIALLKPLLKASLTDDASRPTIDALGETLNRSTEPEELRRAAAALLAECGKPALAFPHIERCLAANGVSADLRLELVKGLNTPLAAARLSEMLKAEMSVVETRSGQLLDQLVFQIRWVLETEDRTETGAAIIAQVERLLQLVARKTSADIDAPARKRFVELAVRACDTLVHVARLSSVDVSACIPALVQLACADTPAAAASLTAIREALNVKAARAKVVEALTSPPASKKLGALYLRQIAGGDEAMTAILLIIYEELGLPPEPLEKMQERLLERARTTEAVLPDRPNSRRTVRDALRSLLAKLHSDTAQHVALIGELMLCEFGARDIVGYVQALKPPRQQIIETALQPHLPDRLVRVAVVVGSIDATLTEDERTSREYASFRTQVQTLARARVGSDLDRALKEGMDDAGRAAITAFAEALRETWVPIAIDKLRENAAPGDARETVSVILLSSLKKAHPASYNNVVLAGLSKEDFIKALDAMSAQLKLDKYAVP